MSIFSRSGAIEEEHECIVITKGFKLCPTDAEVILLVLFLVFFAIWGIPMAIRFFRRCKNSSLMKSTDDVEKGIETDDLSVVSFSTGQLRRTKSPSSFCQPQCSHTRHPSCIIEKDEFTRVKVRLDHFRFPPPLPSRSVPPKRPLPAGPPPEIPSMSSSATLEALFNEPARPDSPTIPSGLFSSPSTPAFFSIFSDLVLSDDDPISTPHPSVYAWPTGPSLIVRNP